MARRLAGREAHGVTVRLVFFGLFTQHNFELTGLPK